MVVKAEHHTTHGAQFFNALVANNGDRTEWLDDQHAIVTVILLGEELGESFSIGDHFSLWSGHELAGGTVTMRLFIWPDGPISQSGIPSPDGLPSGARGSEQ
jgi:hypothetical protein